MTVAALLAASAVTLAAQSVTTVGQTGGITAGHIDSVTCDGDGCVVIGPPTCIVTRKPPTRGAPCPKVELRHLLIGDPGPDFWTRCQWHLRYPGFEGVALRINRDAQPATYRCIAKINGRRTVYMEERIDERRRR